jgi:hypothetical protein
VEEGSAGEQNGSVRHMTRADANNRRNIMTKQFENPNVEKLEDETVSNISPEKRVERVADKAAEKPAKSEQNYDKKNSNLFSK